MMYHLSNPVVTFCGNQVLPAWYEVWTNCMLKCDLDQLLGSDQHENTDLEYLASVNHIKLILVFS